MRSLVAMAVASLFVVGVSVASDAEASIKRFTNIEAQALEPALKALARERDFELVYRSEVVGALATGGVSGEMTADEALTSSLSGTGLTYRYLDETTVTIVPIGTQPKSGEQEGAKNAKTSAVSPMGQKPEEGQTFWDPFRVAQADTSSPPATSRSAVESSDALEEIVVTAQKREERLLDTPQSVTALSADYLSELGATQFRDFANTVPSLSFATSGGSTRPSLRGVTAGADVSPTVGIYVDEVPYGSSTSFAQGATLALDAALFDVSRIEVLRGPQGTLYGASSMGGLIKYVTKEPDTGEFGVDLQTELSSTEHGGTNYNAAAAVNMPIAIDRAALRASAYEIHDDGFIDNVARGISDIDRGDSYGGRLDLLLTPTEPLSIRITGFAQNISRDGETTADYSFSSGDKPYGSLGQFRPFPGGEHFKQRFRLASVTIGYDFGLARLTSMSGYQTMDLDNPYDVTVGFSPFCVFVGLTCDSFGFLNKIELHKFTQEFRLASHGTRAVDWIVGAFYNDES